MSGMYCIIIEIPLTEERLPRSWRLRGCLGAGGSRSTAGVKRISRSRRSIRIGVPCGPEIGSCFVFAGRRYAHRCVVALEDAGFTFKDMLSWEKDKAPHRAQRLSAIYKRRNDEFNERRWTGWRVANLRPLFEPILWFQKPYKTGGTIADNVLENEVGAWNENALIRYNLHTETREVFSNIIKIRTSTEDHGKHVAQKPLELMELLISLVTMEGQTVMDPFMGSGTTCVAAQKLNRHYIGIDIDPKSVHIAKERLNLSAQIELVI